MPKHGETEHKKRKTETDKVEVDPEDLEEFKKFQAQKAAKRKEKAAEKEGQQDQLKQEIFMLLLKKKLSVEKLEKVVELLNAK